MRLTVATFNIRNISDRYRERLPLLTAGFAALSPDIIGLQEVVFSEPRQDDLLARSSSRAYRAVDARHEGHPNFGNAIITAVGEPQAHEELRLSQGRVAHSLLLALPGNKTVWFANTHLHHSPTDAGVRLEQVERILEWLDAAPAADATIVAGDFNTPPFEPAYAAMSERHRSAFLEANGAEPAVTWPSGLQAPTMDLEGDPNCLDYIWLQGNVKAVSARLAFNEHALGDTTLYPSDHFAIVAELDL